MTRRFIIDWLERTAATFVEAFLAVWLIVGDTDPDHLFTTTNAKVGLLAGVLATAKALLATLRGRRDSASLADTI